MQENSKGQNYQKDDILLPEKTLFTANIKWIVCPKKKQNLLIFMFFQTSMTFFHLRNFKGDILRNV